MPLEAAGVLSGTGGGSTAGTGPAYSGNPRKRQRTLVSCTECHRRKQKCDRQWPCGNCTSRSANHLCQYERKARRDEASARKGANTGPESHHTDESGGSGDFGDDSDADLESMMVTRRNASEFGYTMGVQNTSLSVLEKLHISDNQLHPVYSDRTFHFTNPNDLHTYNNFIRLIPARPFTNLLVQVYFTEVNWIYGTLHQPTFTRMLEEWWLIATGSNKTTEQHNTTAQLAAGRNAGSDPYITNDIHFFPSLLLQVLSSAIQFLPREHQEYIGQIKLGICEDFKDFSTRLSNASCELATLLGGTCTSSLNRVIQAFLRAAWLKNEGRMHEAWHSLGSAVRSAQEQGFHLENGHRGSGGSGTLLPGLGGAMRPSGPNGLGEQLKMMWYKEMEKRIWCNLYAWDRHMSMLLGRPTMINDKHCTVSVPVDCEPPADLTSRAPSLRGVMEPPSIFTARILDYRISQIMNEVEEITQAFNATSTPDFVRLDSLHAKLMGLTETFPPEFSVNNRDTAYDNLHPHLTVQSELIKSTVYSVIVALHRPYLFVREKSRREIINAALIMLECQENITMLLKEHHKRLYSICFYTFDPCVLLSAVVITNGSSMDNDTLDACLNALKAGAKRLRMLGVYIKLAEKGAVVLRILLKKVEAIVETLRVKNTRDEVRNRSADGVSNASRRNKSPQHAGKEAASGSRNVRGRKSNTRWNTGTTGASSTFQHQGRQTPDNFSSGSSPSDQGHSNNNPNLDPKAPESVYFEALNAASSYNGQHHHHHHHHHHHSGGTGTGSTTTTTTMPLGWDGAVLMDVPVSQMATGSTMPSTTGPGLMPGVSSASTFDFGKATSHGGGGDAAFSGFFDGTPAFSLSGSNLGSQDGSDGMSAHGEDWGVPHGDGLWQNLLGMFGNDP